MSYTGFDAYMVIVSICGNVFLFVQLISLLKQRHTLSWAEKGSIARALSYCISIWACVSWIIYAIILGTEGMDIVIVSSTIALCGSFSCLVTIIIRSEINRRSTRFNIDQGNPTDTINDHLVIDINNSEHVVEDN